MAGLSSSKNGQRIIFYLNKKKHVFFVGKKYSKTTVKDWVREIERMIEFKEANVAFPPALELWLHSCCDFLKKKLLDVGLIELTVSPVFGEFLKHYLSLQVHLKQSTLTKLETNLKHLKKVFKEDQLISSFNEGTSDQYVAYLRSLGHSEATIRKACCIGKNIFKQAIRCNLISKNPFEGKKTSVKGNRKRLRFVTIEESMKVLEACPNQEWRMIFALARFGGLRIPIELRDLKWSHVLWDENKVLIHSPKTEHHEGGDRRYIPLFPELRDELTKGFEEAEDKKGFVIATECHRRPSANLRTTLLKIINRAGVTPWPKRYQNLRSTRQTELAAIYPIQDVCKWIGNTQTVASEHYLQTQEDILQRAASTYVKSDNAPNHAPKDVESTETLGKVVPPRKPKDVKKPSISLGSTSYQDVYLSRMGDEGRELPSKTQEFPDKESSLCTKPDTTTKNSLEEVLLMISKLDELERLRILELMKSPPD